MTGHEIFVAYEAWHVDLARTHAKGGATIVCLDFLVERELKKQNIPHVSLRDIVDSETGEEEWWVLAQDIAREWYRLPAMKFFEYGGIRIAEVIEPIFEEYLSRLFYYTRIYTALKKMYPSARLSVPVFNVKNEPADVCLSSTELQVASDAARMAGFKVTAIDTALIQRSRSFIKIHLKLLLLRLYNLAIRFVPRLPAQAGHRMKIYIGEYWSHFTPVIEQMDDAELVLMESGALMQISWRQLLKHRIRVRHPNDEIHNMDKNKAMRVSEEFVARWATAKKEVAQYLAGVRGELDWGPVLGACTYLMTHAVKVVTDINTLRRIMTEEKPNVILQSASVAGRHHYFFIMARIAAQLAIPSIELQHGINSIDPRTAYSRFETKYLATYGADTNAWHERMGRPRERLVAVGSPLFDRYFNARAGALEKGKKLFTQLGLNHKRPVLLVTVPFSDTNPSAFDSYQLVEFFEAIHTAQSAIPGMQVLFKFRRHECDEAMREYIQELFRTNSAIAGREELFPLLCASGAVVSGNSTVIYETMLAQKPLVLYPWKSFDIYNAQAISPAAPLVRTAKEFTPVLKRIFSDASYREELMKLQEHFLEGYSFDGKSSGRMREFIRRLSRKQHGPASN